MAATLVFAAYLAIPNALEAQAPTIEATPTTNPVRLDGRLDDPVWRQAATTSDLTQREPDLGEPASQRTRVQVAYTPSSLYFALTVEAQPLFAREQRRDAQLFADDAVALVLDTFHDRRNAYVFETNANGARTDTLVTDEGRDINPQWDGIWRVATQRTESGYTAEVEIPFATLRFDPTKTTWGFQIQRRIPGRTEQALWAPIGRDADELRISLAGTLTGLEGIEPGRQLQIKPYITASSTRTRGEAKGRTTEDDADVGLDVKWGVTRNLALDVTLNTDFAEVEVDEAQVNLTRFPLFFPEKREFFLENAGIFEFGPVKTDFDFDPLLMKVFFSRRIGLDDQGRSVPIRWGTRLTGRVGDGWNLGALVTQTRSEDQERTTTEFGVARIVRNLGERSNLGLIATERQASDGTSNRVLGLDGTFRPNQNFTARAFATLSRDQLRRTDRPGGGGGDGAREGHSMGLLTDWQSDTWSADLEALEVDRDFEPGMGFLLRRDFRFIKPRFQLKTRVERFGIRNLRMGYSFKHISQKSTGIMESRQLSGDLIGFETTSGASFFIWAESTTERLFEAFEIWPDVVIQPGRYDFDPAFNLFVWSPPQHQLTMQFGVSDGGFFDGDQTSVSTTLNYRPNKFWQTQLSHNWDDVRLPAGEFTAEVLRLRASVNFSPNQRLDALTQWSDAAELLGVNVRFNWIYRPGADLFLVYNKQWQAASLSRTETLGDQLVLKFTYLFGR